MSMVVNENETSNEESRIQILKNETSDSLGSFTFKSRSKRQKLKGDLKDVFRGFEGFNKKFYKKKHFRIDTFIYMI